MTDLFRNVVNGSDFTELVLLQFDMEGQYHYQPVGNMENEGIYSVNYRLSTPFEALDHVFFDFNLQAEKYFFASNLTIDIVDNRIQMDGTLEVTFVSVIALNDMLKIISYIKQSKI